MATLNNSLAILFKFIINPDNPLNLIRAMTTHPPLCKRGARGDLSVDGIQKSPSVPLLQREMLVKFPNGLSGINQSGGRTRSSGSGTG
jgi:hypothetical protein